MSVLVICRKEGELRIAENFHSGKAGAKIAVDNAEGGRRKDV